MGWKKKINYRMEKDGFDDWEYVNDEGIIIRVTHSKEQGLPGSNQVTVYGLKGFGGYLLDTPKNFSKKADAVKFANYCKKQINKKEYGKMIPWSK